MKNFFKQIESKKEIAASKLEHVKIRLRIVVGMSLWIGFFECID